MASEIRPMKGSSIDADGHCPDVDEVVGDGSLHIERMSATTFWARLYAKNGSDVVMWLNAVDGRLMVEAGYESQDDAAHASQPSQPAEPVSEAATENCGCIACLDSLPPDDDPIPRSRRRMVLCSICGNKRCPHATDHRHACTGSNESGQPGSRFGPASEAATEPRSVNRITEGVRDMLAILESSDATEDEKDAAASTIVEAVAPEIMERAYGKEIRAWDAASDLSSKIGWESAAPAISADAALQEGEEDAGDFAYRIITEHSWGWTENASGELTRDQEHHRRILASELMTYEAHLRSALTTAQEERDAAIADRELVKIENMRAREALESIVRVDAAPTTPAEEP